MVLKITKPSKRLIIIRIYIAILRDNSDFIQAMSRSADIAKIIIKVITITIRDAIILFIYIFFMLMPKTAISTISVLPE